MQTETLKKISLIRQLLTCALLCILAVAVIFLFDTQPYVLWLLAGPPLFYQILFGAMIGALYWAGSGVGYKYMAKRQVTQSVVENYGRLDLRGWNPLWISLAAGFGEELLFRGAMQPLIGIWLTSALFVLAHTRAYRFNKFNKRVLVQSLGIFGGSVAFGFLAIYVGLLTAMIVHVAVDVAGLYTIRRVINASPEAPAIATA
jgi:membrane protease YdiL (CAAX protease family)